VSVNVSILKQYAVKEIKLVSRLTLLCSGASRIGQ